MAIRSSQPHSSTGDATERVPPLENGDRLSRKEFERRYAAMPHIKKAELIEGVVYMAAALRFRSRGQPHGNLMIWLGNYKVATLGTELADNTTLACPKRGGYHVQSSLSRFVVRR